MTADISNVKIEDNYIFYEDLIEMTLPAQDICISSESSQEDIVSIDEDLLPSLNQFIKSFPILIS